MTEELTKLELNEEEFSLMWDLIQLGEMDEEDDRYEDWKSLYNKLMDS